MRRRDYTLELGLSDTQAKKTIVSNQENDSAGHQGKFERASTTGPKRLSANRKAVNLCSRKHGRGREVVEDTVNLSGVVFSNDGAVKYQHTNIGTALTYSDYTPDNSRAQFVWSVCPPPGK